MDFATQLLNRLVEADLMPGWYEVRRPVTGVFKHLRQRTDTSYFNGQGWFDGTGQPMNDVRDVGGAAPNVQDTPPPGVPPPISYTTPPPPAFPPPTRRQIMGLDPYDWARAGAARNGNAPRAAEGPDAWINSVPYDDESGSTPTQEKSGGVNLHSSTMIKNQTPSPSFDETSTSRDENQALCALLSLATFGILRFFAVPQGYTRFITLFGRPLKNAQPGLNVCLSLLSLYQRPGAYVPTKEQIISHEADMVFTKDGVKCTVEVVVFFRIVDAVKAFYEITNYKQAIAELVKAMLRNECGGLAARELLGSRQRLASNLRNSLDQDTAPWGINVRLVEVKAIDMAVQQAN